MVQLRPLQTLNPVKRINPTSSSRRLNSCVYLPTYSGSSINTTAVDIKLCGGCWKRCRCSQECLLVEIVISTTTALNDVYWHSVATISLHV